MGGMEVLNEESPKALPLKLMEEFLRMETCRSKDRKWTNQTRTRKRLTN